MESRTKVAGHPLHQMIIVFPLGLLATATAFDGYAAARHERRFYEVAQYLIGAGVVTGLVSAVPGAIDFLAIPNGTRAKRIGLIHGLGNVIVTGLFAASWFARRRRPARPSTRALALSGTATALAVITGWLGGELVNRLGVGVDTGAHLDAPNSLTNDSATDYEPSFGEDEAIAS